MAQRLGSAYVSIEADTTLFRSSTLAGMAKALAGIKGEVPITASVDFQNATAALLALKARMEALADTLATLRINADTGPAEAKIATLQAKMLALSKVIANIQVGADTSKIDAAIAAEEAKFAGLKQQLSDLQVDANIAAAAAKIATLEQQYARLENGLDNLKADVDIEAALAKMYAIETELKVLRSDAVAVKLAADTTALNAALAASAAKIKALSAQKVTIETNIDAHGIVAAEAQLLGLEAAAKAAAGDGGIGGLNTALVTGGGAWGRYGLGVLGARVALFGGLTTISGWHLAIDGVVEALAVLVPAVSVLAGGLGAFVGAALEAQDTAGRIADRLRDVYTVSQATGQVIPPLTGAFDKMAGVIRPEVFSLYGAAINAAGGQLGLFGKLAESTGSVLDRIAADIVVDMNGSGKGVSDFVSAGERDLKELGNIFLNLGSVIASLIRVTQTTHIADFLLDAIDVASKFLALIAQLPTPVLAVVVALHGLYIYGGLAVTGIQALLNPLARLAGTVAGSEAAGSAVKDLGKAAEEAGENPAGFPLLQATISDIGTGFAALGTKLSNWGSAVVDALKSPITSLQGFGSNFATAFSGVEKGADDSEKAATGLGGALGELAASPWTWAVVAVGATTALALALYHTQDATSQLITTLNKGVSASTIFNAINTTASALATTNQALSVSAQQVNTAMSQQQKAVTGAASRFESNYSPALDHASTDLSNLQQEHNLLLGELNTETTRITQVAKAYGTDGLAGAMALASLAGVNVNDFINGNAKAWAIDLQEIADVVKGYQEMGQGSGQLANDINALTVTNSDQLASIAKLNTAWDSFTSIVAGPVNTFNTFAQSLVQFGSDAKVAGAQLGGLGDGAIAGASKVTTASLQLSTDFQSAYSAGEQLFDAMRNTGSSAAQQVQAIKLVVQSLIPLAGNNKLAAAEISSLAQEAGGPATTSLSTLSNWAGKTANPVAALQKVADNAAIGFANLSGDAQKLATTLQSDLSADMATAVENAIGLQGALNAFAKAVQNGTQNTAAGHAARQQLYNDLVIVTGSSTQANAKIQAMSDILTGSTTPAVQKTHDPLVTQQNDITAVGNKSYTAAGQIAGYTSALDKIPKSISTTISAFASGSGQIVFNESAPGVVFASGGQGNIIFHGAGGGMIPGHGGPRADDQIIAASSGEYMINAASAKKIGIPMLNSLNKYASGGIITGTIPNPSGPSSSATAAAQDFVKNSEGAFMNAAVTSLKNALAQQSAAAAGAAGPAQAYAKSIMSKYGFAAGQFPALQALWDRESNWRWNATNPQSGAYGIPQALPASKMASAGADWRTDYQTQVRWGLGYIKSTYGSPGAAWNHENAFGWYSRGGLVMDKGGWLMPGLNPPIYNGTGRPEPVGPAGAGGITLEVTAGGSSAFEAFMLQMIRNFVRVQGGGNVQKAFGRGQKIVPNGGHF